MNKGEMKKIEAIINSRKNKRLHKKRSVIILCNVSILCGCAVTVIYKGILI